MSDLTMSDTQTIQTQAKHPMFFLMNNVIQNYAWGSTTSVNQLFGIENPTGEPQAEVWMGAHPNGCSLVMVNGEETKLSSLIAQDMNAFLSEEVANRFGELPYLFKVLAAECTVDSGSPKQTASRIRLCSCLLYTSPSPRDY